MAMTRSTTERVAATTRATGRSTEVVVVVGIVVATTSHS
jgi:hypothetical protein